jgi:transposase
MGDVRLVLTEEVWADMAEVLAQVTRKDGRPPDQSDRTFLEAVLYLARTGVPWRDLPGEFGHWDAVYHRFRRWEKRGVWRKLWEGLQQDRFKMAKQVFIDSTIVRAHQHAAGALKKTVGKRPRLWAVLGEVFPPRFTSDALMSGQA